MSDAAALEVHGLKGGDGVGVIELIVLLGQGVEVAKDGFKLEPLAVATLFEPVPEDTACRSKEKGENDNNANAKDNNGAGGESAA